MAILSTTLSTSATSVLTSSGDMVATTMYFCNNGASSATFTLHAVPNGGTADGTNIVYSSVPLTAYDTYTIDTEKLILSNGDSLRALSSVSGNVVCTVSYIGI